MPDQVNVLPRPRQHEKTGSKRGRNRSRSPHDPAPSGSAPGSGDRLGRRRRRSSPAHVAKQQRPRARSPLRALPPYPASSPDAAHSARPCLAPSTRCRPSSARPPALALPGILLPPRFPSMCRARKSTGSSRASCRSRGSVRVGCRSAPRSGTSGTRRACRSDPSPHRPDSAATPPARPIWTRSTRGYRNPGKCRVLLQSL